MVFKAVGCGVIKAEGNMKAYNKTILLPVVCIWIAIVSLGVSVYQVRTNAVLGESYGGVAASAPTTYDRIFSAEPGPDVSTLKEIVGDDTSDADILSDIVDYYNANKDRLALLWREDDPTRLAGIFSMYVVHISTAYGEVAAFPTSLEAYLSDDRAHCGTYTWAQREIAAMRLA